MHVNTAALIFVYSQISQCFDTVGWVSGRASGP